MGLDIKMFRNEESLLHIINSEKLRGRNKENIDLVLRSDSAWRKGQTMLDAINAKLNLNHKKIKENRKSQISCEDLIKENKSLESIKKDLIVSIKRLKNVLKFYLSLIGNILRPQEDSQKISSCKIFKTCFLGSVELIKKQSVISQFLYFSLKSGYQVVQTPSLCFKKLIGKIFPHKSFLQIPASKPRVLVSSPVQSLVSSYYKSTVSSPLFLSAYGVYFSVSQKEKLCFTVIHNSYSEDVETQLLELTREFILGFFDSVEVLVRPCRFTKNSCSIQYDFIIDYLDDKVVICTLSNYSDFLSRRAKIKSKTCCHPWILSSTFHNIQYF